MKTIPDEITVKEFLDPHSGEIHRRYSFKRKPCKRTQLKSRAAQHLAGYALIEKDLRSVLTWLQSLEKLHTERPHKKGLRFGHSSDRERYDLIKGLFVAVLTFYGKCFSHCEGRTVKLERAQLDPEFQGLHDTCISYRHNFAAHSGAAKLEAVEVVVAHITKRPGKVIWKIFRELNQPDVFWPDDSEKAIHELVEHARQIAISKMAKLTDKIKREEVLPAICQFLES